MIILMFLHWLFHTQSGKRATAVIYFVAAIKFAYLGDWPWLLLATIMAVWDAYDGWFKDRR